MTQLSLTAETTTAIIPTFTWSPQQEEIFHWFADRKPGTCLVVIARAGCTKTSTSVEAIKYAPKEDQRIIACAFNKAIERELAAKITDKRCTVKTLHGAGFGVMMRAWHCNLDNARGVRIARTVCGGESAMDDAVTMVAALTSVAKGISPYLGVKRGDYNGDAAAMEDLSIMMDLAEEFGHCPDQAMERAGWTLQRVCNAAIECMRRTCDKTAGRASATTNTPCIDFDDMVYLPVRLSLARETYDLTVVDEAQDMSPSQILLAQALTKSTGRMVYVGDDQQAIYSFRGADVTVLSRVVEQFSADTLPLNVTRRCPKSVVALAQTIVPDFTATDDAPEGIVDFLPSGDKMLDAAKPGDAILSRKNAPLAGLCLSLLRRGVRARIEGRDIGAALIGLAKKIAGKARDIETFLSRLQAWSSRRVAKLLETAKKRGDARLADEKIGQIVDQSDTLAAIAEDVDSVDDLCRKVSELFSNSEDSTQPQVTLSSVHKAKGKEWRRVFVLTETLRNGGEEDRIRYVAYTRAKSHLTFVDGFESKRLTEE